MREMLLTDMRIVRTRMPNSGMSFLSRKLYVRLQLAVLLWV